MKYRDKLTFSMAGRDSFGSCHSGGTADYSEEEHSNPVIRSFIASFDVALIDTGKHTRLSSLPVIFSIILTAGISIVYFSTLS